MEMIIHGSAKNHQNYPKMIHPVIFLICTYSSLTTCQRRFVAPYVAVCAEDAKQNGNICAKCAKNKHKIFAVKIILNMV